MKTVFIPLRMCANFFSLVQFRTQFFHLDFIETQSSLFSSYYLTATRSWNPITHLCQVLPDFLASIWCMHMKSLQLCSTLCSLDHSLPGSSVHGILQARILEWTVIPSSRGSSWLRDRTFVCLVPCIGTTLPLAPPMIDSP